MTDRTKVYGWMALLCIGVADGVGQPCDEMAGHVRRTAHLAALGGAGSSWFRPVEDDEGAFWRIGLLCREYSLLIMVRD